MRRLVLHCLIWDVSWEGGKILTKSWYEKEQEFTEINCSFLPSLLSQQCNIQQFFLHQICLSVHLSIIYKKLGILFTSLLFFFFFFNHLLLVVSIFTVLQGRRRGLILLFHRCSGAGLFLHVYFSRLSLALYAVELTFYSYFLFSLADITGTVHFSNCKHQDRVLSL